MITVIYKRPFLIYDKSPQNCIKFPDLDDSQMPAVVPEPPPKPAPSEVPPPCMMRSRWHACPELHKAMDGVTYIADHTRKEEDSTRVSDNFFSILCTFKRNLIKHRPQTIITPFPGERGLEIRGNGSRSTIPLDFHDSRCGGNRRYYFTGAHLI